MIRSMGLELTVENCADLIIAGRADEASRRWLLQSLLEAIRRQDYAKRQLLQQLLGRTRSTSGTSYGDGYLMALLLVLCECETDVSYSALAELHARAVTAIRERTADYLTVARAVAHLILGCRRDDLNRLRSPLERSVEKGMTLGLLIGFCELIVEARTFRLPPLLDPPVEQLLVRIQNAPNGLTSQSALDDLVRAGYDPEQAIKELLTNYLVLWRNDCLVLAQYGRVYIRRRTNDRWLRRVPA